jgi:polysaccharide biosynthesis transport protein
MASEPHFQQLIGLLRWRRRLILTIAAFGTILAGVTGLLITPKYTAKAQILVEPQAATLLSPEVVQQAIDTHVTMLTSANHLQHVVDSLLNGPELGGAAPETRTEIEASGLDGDARSRSVAAAQELAKPITTEVGPLSFKELRRRLNVWLQALARKRGDGTELTYDELDRSLKVMQERRSRVITISFQWTSPEKAAAIANRIVELYVQNQSEQQRAYSIREMARLEDRIVAIKSDVERTSAALQKAIERRLDARQSVGSEEQEAEADPRELQRRAATSAHVYANLLQRQKEIREQQDLIKSDANILALASPPVRPSSPNPILFMLPALIASLLCGSWLAVVLEGLDRGLRSEREIKDALGIPCVGFVPRIPRGRPTHLGEYLLAEPFSTYAEAIRSAVAMLRLAEPGHAAKVVLISSSIPGEGKTTLAQSLAAFVGFQGRRVLLVDVDFQQGSQPSEFDDTGEKGIVDLSLQNRTPAERIWHIAEAGFDYLPMPGHRRDPLTLFASEQMPGLIRQLRERYDCVIIDGPPVLGPVEARLLPSIVDRLLFVVKWGSTRREVAQNALSLLRNSGDLTKDRSELAMAIVTRVDLKRHARYRYGDVSRQG